jgi:hypothetical protein
LRVLCKIPERQSYLRFRELSPSIVLTSSKAGRTVSLRMKVRRFLRRLSTSALFVVVCACAWPAGAGDGEIAEASRKPGGINPADIDSRCSIMAGRTDRAYIPCFAFVDQGSGRTAAVQFLIDNNLINAPARGPLRIYTDEEAQALGLIPGPGAVGPTYRRR